MNILWSALWSHFIECYCVKSHASFIHLFSCINWAYPMLCWFGSLSLNLIYRFVFFYCQLTLTLHSTLPFLFCGLTGNCQYASRNDFTYWLAGDVRQPMMPVTNDAVEPFVSRCVVCEAPDANIAVHSQDESTPTCPVGYDSLWSGYSFMMVRYSFTFFLLLILIAHRASTSVFI